MDLFDQWNPGPLPTRDDETFLTRDDHDRVADKLSGLHAALTAVEQRGAPLKAALEDAVRLVEALQAGLTRDCVLVSLWCLPPYLGSCEGPSLRMIPDALEISEIIRAKHPCDCILLTAHRLSVTIARVQELLTPGLAGEAISPGLRRVTEEHPLPGKISPTQTEYQQVIEHLAALNVYVHLLAQAAYMPAYGNLWGLSAELLETLGYPEGMPESFGILGKSATDEIAWGQEVVPALFYGVKQHCLLNRYVLDYAAMDQVRRNLQGPSMVDPDDALEALVPTARVMHAILAGRSTCACISNAARQVVEAMEAVRSLAPRPQTH